MIRHWLTILDVPAVICSARGSQFVGSWIESMCKHMGVRLAKTMANHSRSNGRVELTRSQIFEKFRQLHTKEPGRHWFHSLWRVLQGCDDLPGPTGLSSHRILFVRLRASRTLPWMNHGKVARDADAVMSETDTTAAKMCKSLHDEHVRRVEYSKKGKIHKYSLKDTVWLERHRKDVLTCHRHQSWYIVRKIRQDVYARILDRDDTQRRPRAPDPSGRAVKFVFTVGDLDSDDDSEEDDYTVSES